MTIEQAIKKAYPNQKEMFSPGWGVERYLLSPDFWQSLGKALGSEHSEKIGRKRVEVVIGNSDWRIVWHRFMDHFADGRPAEDFFADFS